MERPSAAVSKAVVSKKKAPAQARAPRRRADRVFVLDTNVLIHDAASIFAFKGVTVVIPLIVLEELDKFKSDNGERGRNVREVIRKLDELRSKGNLRDGVPLDPIAAESVLKVLPTPTEDNSSLCINSVDNQIIHTVQHLVAEGNVVTFVTKDINARVKADALGLDAEDYTRGTISLDDYYKGWIKLQVSSHELKTFGEKNLVEIAKDASLFPNQYLVLEHQHNPWHYRVFRHLPTGHFKEVSQPNLGWNFAAKNLQQLMACDLLMDDSIQVLTLLGPAGTGKTFLTLLIGLYKVMTEHAFRKFLISRPIVALGADIGFLPGDVQEKLFHWMQPVYDNLEFIFSQMATPEQQHQLLGQKPRHKENGKKKHGDKHRHHETNGGSGYHETKKSVTDIDILQQRGILSLEAITYMRGRSIPHQFVFIDEVQNLTPHEVKTIVSRAGAGTKVILAGDPHQIDSPYLDFSSNGLTVTTEKLKDQSIFGTVYLEISERSELAKLAAEVL